MPQGVLIVAEHREGKIQGPTLEMVAKGRDLVSKHGGKLTAALFGQGVDALAGELAQYPVDQVLVGENEALKSYTPEGYSQALKAMVDQVDPLVILMAHTTQGYDFAPRLAVEWNLPLAAGCVDVAVEGQGIIVTRRVLNEKIAVDLEFGGAPRYIVTIRAATFKPAEKGGAGAQVQKVPVQIDVVKIIRKVLGVEKPQVADVDITAADVVVAVGRGIGKKENLALVQTDHRRGVAAKVPPGRPEREDDQGEAVHRLRHQRRDAACGGDEGLRAHHSDQHGPERSDIRVRALWGRGERAGNLARPGEGAEGRVEGHRSPMSS
jgi:electron transfer flavoprotein alpha subunit